MNMYVDDDTGCVVIDDIQEGIELLPTPLYQSYLKQIEDLKKEVSDLEEKLISSQEKVSDLHDKLTNIAVAQNKTIQMLTEVSDVAVTDARRVGFALGLFCKDPKEYKSNYAYYEDIKHFLLEDTSDFSKPPLDSES